MKLVVLALFAFLVSGLAFADHHMGGDGHGKDAVHQDGDKHGKGMGMGMEKGMAKGKGKMQGNCPMKMGDKINKSVFTVFEGKKIYFCCADCKANFEKMTDAEKEQKIKLMEEKGIVLDNA